ncbi:MULTISPECIES: DUF262 domain-containing protein [unclassified Brucella]|uniref:DUF262 domain-containing protein n=1 Tax=unclassified Brucella TaxID=2632610 RepID=UPI00217E460B|nr:MULTISPECIES: DUF262 domain-containing protein [unclassified Brucella]UWF67894.1 DUF262 domain-containing protein [Brucella sp. 1315]UWF71011.1 DUF262 domain-containing protein [Brucella sp. 2594]
MPLLDEVNEKRTEIRTDDYAMSIGEWLSLYEDEEIDIHPEFQRFFRWSDRQKTNLIESILLGIPLPPIFVSQRPDGIWDVVDGLQRLSTIYQLFGVLKDENKNLADPLVLGKTEYLPSLDNMSWNGGGGTTEIPPEIKLLIKRSKIHVSIILKESDDNAKYDLFQRLNTGGSQLSPQEVRNCILVMLDKSFYKWLLDLSSYENFKNVTALSDRPLQEAYDLELILRFIIFTAATEEQLGEVGDVGVYLTNAMRTLAIDETFDRNEWATLFKSTFDVLADKVGEAAFKRFNAQKKRHEGGFLVSQFEVVATGIASNIRGGTLANDLSDRIAKLWSTDEFTKWTGAGVTASRRLPHLIPLGKSHFSQ